MTTTTNKDKDIKLTEDQELVIKIALQRAKHNKEKYEASKQSIVLDAAMELLEKKMKKELIARTLVKRLVNKETDVSKTTVYRALEAPEFKEFKNQKISNAAKIARAKSNINPSHVGRTEAQTAAEETKPIEQPITTPVLPIPTIGSATAEAILKIQTDPERLKEIRNDEAFYKATVESNIRIGLAVKLVNEISGMDEGEQKEFAKSLPKGKSFRYELVNHCKQHIFELVSKMPENHVDLELAHNQTLEALLKEYNDQLSEKLIKMKSRKEVSGV